MFHPRHQDLHRRLTGRRPVEGATPEQSISQFIKEHVRTLARTILFLLLRCRARALIITKDRPVLVIAPHPDDAELGCGGLILTRSLRRLTTHVAYLTDGAGSHSGHPSLTPEKLAEIRHAEALRAQITLGTDLSCVHFLNLPDGELSRLAAEQRASAVQALAALIVALHPAQVFLPAREDGSSEHSAGFLLVGEALKGLAIKPRLLEFPVWARWNPRFLAHPLIFAHKIHRLKFAPHGTIKQAALDAFASQFQPTAPWLDPVLPSGFREAFDSEEEYFFEFVN